MLEAEGLEVRIGDTRVLLDRASFAIERVASTVALVGPNGSGRRPRCSRRFSGAAERRRRLGPPRSRRRGGALLTSRRWSSTLAARCCNACSARLGLQRPDAQKLLGRFLFSGWTEQARSPSSHCPAVSGAGFALALVVASGANFLVVDEPTNHLDLESREALEAALEAIPGTVLLVSHDRALLDAVAERTLAIEDKRLNSYDGGWAEYVRQREARRVAAIPTPEPRGRAEGAQGGDATKAKGPSELERIEAEIAAREQTVAELERQLAGGLERCRDACSSTVAPATELQARSLNNGSDLFRAGAHVTEESTPEPH